MRTVLAVLISGAGRWERRLQESSVGHSCRGGMSVVPPVGCPRKDREQMAGPRWLPRRIPGHSGKTQGDVCRCSFAKIDTVQRSGPTFELNSMSTNLEPHCVEERDVSSMQEAAKQICQRRNAAHDRLSQMADMSICL